MLLLVLYDPWLARSYGFLLSVLATGALLTLAPRLERGAAAAAGCRPGSPRRWPRPPRRRRCARRWWRCFAARVSLVAIPCNLLAELAVAPATVLGFAALAAAPVAMPVAELLAWCAGWPAGWIASVARTGAALPGAEAGWPGGWRGGLLLAAVTVLVVLLGAPAAAASLGWPPCARCCCCSPSLRPVPLTRVITGWPPPGWTFAMCDVGQGDATVLAAGDGTAVVVDAGPDPELADRCLRDLGVTRVPLLLLTHFHADHVAGLPGVLRGRAVGAIADDGARRAAGPGRVRTADGGCGAGAGGTGRCRGSGAGSGRSTGEVLWPRGRPGGAPVDRRGPTTRASPCSSGSAAARPCCSSATSNRRPSRGCCGPIRRCRRSMSSRSPTTAPPTRTRAAARRAPAAGADLLSAADNPYGHPVAPYGRRAAGRGARWCCVRTRTGRSR